MDRFYSELGARMRAVRKTLRYTQAQVAESAGIDASFYGQIERGRNIPSLKTFVAVAKALGVGPADLLAADGFPERVYGRVMERLLGGLDSRKKRLLLGMVGDIAGRLKK